ncbi:MAG TPA: thioredoxin family protein [Anaerolineales bacterium]|nr:thioredoxin family protein [Anaerolineales bacterium]
MVTVKILSLGSAERYSLRRLVVSVQQELLSQNPNLEIWIAEVSDASEIGRHANVLVLPTLVIDEKVVCSGRFPTREEVVDWLGEALHAH